MFRQSQMGYNCIDTSCRFPNPDNGCQWASRIYTETFRRTESQELARSSPAAKPVEQKKNTFGCENFVDFHNRKRIYHINILISIVCRKLDRVGIAGHERHSKMLEVYGLTWKTVQTSYIFWVRIQIGSNSATHSTLDDSSSNPNKSSIVPYWNVQGGAPAVRNEL